MADKDSRKIVPGGFFQELGIQFKLIVRLMADRRVSTLLKALPIGTLIYLIVPDLIIGPLDDAAVVGMGLYFFIELCPQHIVEEHRQAILREMQGNVQPQSEVIEGKFQDVSTASNPSNVTADKENTSEKEEGV